MTTIFTQNDIFFHLGQFLVLFSWFAQLYITFILFSVCDKSLDPRANWGKLNHTQIINYRWNILGGRGVSNSYFARCQKVQVNLCQKLFFLHNMERMCCVQKLFWISETISVHNMFSPGLSLEFSHIKLVIQWTISRPVVGYLMQK